ncbi:MAG TPA: adenylate/guanylate cyclase domain-containing protein [Lacunisphaera sp.]|nr:adenylate/guanylate cyclase domain-containing protein [Lacunisphaera sp.]
MPPPVPTAKLVLSPTSSGSEAIAAIRGLIRRGEYLAAYDAAEEAEVHEFQPALGSVARAEIRYLRVLALARSGGSRRAVAETAGLTASLPADLLPLALAEDIAALSARVAKEHALQAPLPERPALAAAAAAAYEDVYRRLHRSYAGVNAATLWRIAGRTEHAHELARDVLEIVARETSGLTGLTGLTGPTDAGHYWAWVTRAEALLVLGDSAGAVTALATAAVGAQDDLGAHATTRRQLRFLCHAVGVDPKPVVEVLAQPEVVHFCGHMTAPPGAPSRFPQAQQAAVTEKVRERLRARRVGFAHGSLACGADIIIAEIALELGAELHLVLPFAIDEFVAISVAPGGPGWTERFRHCLAAAASVTVASDSAYFGDNVLFAYAARIAMGQAMNRAASIDARIWQLAVFDGEEGSETGGTAHDIQQWRRAGGMTEIIQVNSTRAYTMTPFVVSSNRVIRSVLFGDFKGFSRLHDEHIKIFLATVMQPVAEVLDRYAEHVIVRNTWGDGLFVVMDDAVNGASCALDLQERLHSVDLAAAGLPADLGLRLGGHTAPLVPVYDPVLRLPMVMGRGLTRAARIEPRTPTGEVYVTAAFAALLRLEPECGVTPEYVGHLTTAKDFETTPMYLLRRQHAANRR